MAEGNEQQKGGKKAEKRDYSVYAEFQLDADMLTDDARAKIATLIGTGQEGPWEVQIRAGRALQSDPKKALEVVGELRGLNGDFGVVADSAIKKLPVKTETKTTATVG